MDAFWSKNFEFIFIHAANFTLKISFAQGVNAYCKGSKCMKIIAISTSPVLLMIGLFGYDQKKYVYKKPLRITKFLLVLHPKPLVRVAW